MFGETVFFLFCLMIAGIIVYICVKILEVTGEHAENKELRRKLMEYIPIGWEIEVTSRHEQTIGFTWERVTTVMIQTPGMTHKNQAHYMEFYGTIDQVCIDDFKLFVRKIKSSPDEA